MNELMYKIQEMPLKERLKFSVGIITQRVVAGVVVIALAGVGIGLTVHNANVATAKQAKIQKEERLAADKAKKAKEKAAADAKAAADKKAAEE